MPALLLYVHRRYLHAALFTEQSVMHAGPTQEQGEQIRDAERQARKNRAERRRCGESQMGAAASGVGRQTMLQLQATEHWTKPSLRGPMAKLSPGQTVAGPVRYLHELRHARNLLATEDPAVAYHVHNRPYSRARWLRPCSCQCLGLPCCWTVHAFRLRCTGSTYYEALLYYVSNFFPRPFLSDTHMHTYIVHKFCSCISLHLIADVESV